MGTPLLLVKIILKLWLYKILKEWNMNIDTKHHNHGEPVEMPKMASYLQNVLQVL